MTLYEQPGIDTQSLGKHNMTLIAVPMKSDMKVKLYPL